MDSAGGSSSTSANILAKDKLKILCLHGYRQNAETFKSKLGSFRKIVSKFADLVFICAPHTAPPIDENHTDYDPNTQKSWWFNKEETGGQNRSFKGTNKNGPAFGFEESLRLVEKTWKEDEYHGLLGFSQGACFAGLLCSLSERGMTCIKPQFVILSSGFKSGSLAHLNYYEDKITIPSLHIFGETDNVIPNEMSEELSDIFQDPKILKHSGGHYFPSTTQQKEFYRKYLQEQLQVYLEAKEIQYANSFNSVTIFNEANGDDDSSE
ncbi:Esterase [Pseudolycoriella hygida]|uniref:Esterase n=1 Tax=Pseudolycoriella hygida TaxID=35572 RepID=A0A9Q0MJF2_9DIPT|nr:Esterase [Pseudolycoriella hygida]